MFIPIPSNQENEQFFKKMFLEFQNFRRDQHMVQVHQETDEVEFKHLSQVYMFAEFGKLTSGLFHDLINPITALSLQIEELKLQQNQPKKIQDLVDQAFHATKHLENFLKNIRKQIQNQEEKEVFSLSHEIEQALTLLGHKAQALKVDTLSDLPLESKFFGNSIKFHQMMVNLLSNAIDAYEEIPDPKKPVEVKLKKIHNQWKIEIKDYGIGIPESQKQYIFEPLFTTKKSSNGVGIGLCIVKYKIEKEFSGTIEVCDTSPQGTTFVIHFPHSDPPPKEMTEDYSL